MKLILVIYRPREDSPIDRFALLIQDFPSGIISRKSDFAYDGFAAMLSSPNNTRVPLREATSLVTSCTGLNLCVFPKNWVTEQKSHPKGQPLPVCTVSILM